MRKTICDKCRKEIEINEEYISINSTLEVIGENRRVTELSEKELYTFHKKCIKKQKENKK